MAKKDKNRKSLQFPWMSAQNQELDSVMLSLAQELHDRHRAASSEKSLTLKERSALQREFKNAEQARGTLRRYMMSVAEKMGINPPESAVVIADMKEWERAVDKLKAPGRNLHDLGRGRIKIRSPQELKLFSKLISGKDSEGHLPGTSHDISIIPDSMNNYLATPRSSGYAGSLNFDVVVDIGKSRWGTMEIQIMPEDYEDMEKRAHKIFDIVRILQEIPERLRSKDQQYILTGLLIANRALYDEQSFRAGFADVREVPIKKLSRQELRQAVDVLERMRNAIEILPARKRDWINETADALTYAKTSALNMHLAQMLGHRIMVPDHHPAQE